MKKQRSLSRSNCFNMVFRVPSKYVHRFTLIMRTCSSLVLVYMYMRIEVKREKQDYPVSLAPGISNRINSQFWFIEIRNFNIDSYK